MLLFVLKLNFGLSWVLKKLMPGLYYNNNIYGQLGRSKNGKREKHKNVNVQAANGKTAGNIIQVIHRLKRNNKEVNRSEIAKNL